MPRPIYAVLAVCAGALAGCDTGSQSPTLAVGPGFQVTTIDWEDSEAVTRLAYGLRENTGMTEVCGVVASEGSAAVTALEPQLLGAGRLVDGDTVILPSLASFSRASSVAQGTPAGCVLTQVPWNADWAEKPPQVTVKTQEFKI
ncbi:hypothetical protein ACW9UR_14600 [Halovulum sp. GXIMD14794]